MLEYTCKKNKIISPMSKRRNKRIDSHKFSVNNINK